MKYLILLVSGLLILSSCEKIVAKDITDETPVLILPTAGSVVTTNPIHFKWNEMEGAEKYHLMVVSPSFNAIQNYVLDTLVTGTNFYFPLDSNAYELKLVGVNAGYRSDTLGPVAFEVNATGQTSLYSVTLLTPPDQHADNSNFSHQFTWQSLPNATSYEIDIRKGTSFATGIPVDFANGVSTTSYISQETLVEGQYIWGVKAYLSNGSETFFSTNQLYIDETDPNEAILSTPGDLSSQNQGNISFIWNNGTDPGTVNTEVTSILEISNEATFLNPDTYNIVGNSNTVSITTPGTYYWRVTNIDAAGNQATTSPIYQFSVF